MDGLTRRGFIGGLLAAAAAAVIDVPVLRDEPVFVFECFTPFGEVTKRYEFTRAQVEQHGMSAPLSEVHAQLLVDLLTYGTCILRVTHGGRRVYGRDFSCKWVDPGDTRYGKGPHERAAKQWRRLIGDTRDATYRDRLQALPAPEREHLLDGDWPEED